MRPIKMHLSRKPWILSVIILLGIGAWLLSGLSPTPEPVAPSEIDTSQPSLAAPLAKVVVSRFQSQPVNRSISLYGRTAPDRQATLGAEVSGTVDMLLVRKGEHVQAGQALVQLDTADRAIQLQRAQAQLRVRDKEFKAAKSLRERGLQGEVALTRSEAALIEAQSAVRKLELALENTVINAPFDGIVELLHIEQGDFLGVGDPIATIVDLDPLVINVDVSERHIQQIHRDQEASISLVTGFSTIGKLRYQATIASPQTNTFGIELEIPNADMKHSAGISAEVELTLDTQPAIKITPSMLALDELGNLGIKTLDAENRVVFVPISIVKVEPDGVWLGGVGDSVDLITVGQGFVRDGDDVIPVRRTGSE